MTILNLGLLLGFGLTLIASTVAFFAMQAKEDLARGKDRRPAKGAGDAEPLHIKRL